MIKIQAALFVAAAGLAFGQQDDILFAQAVPGPGVPGEFGGKTIRFVSGQLVNSAVKASPYSAESVVESTQTLADGNRIANRTVTKQFRDSDGRERREMSLGENEQVVLISDPVASASYSVR